MPKVGEAKQDERTALLVSTFDALPDVMLLVRRIDDDSFELVASSSQAGEVLGVADLRVGDRICLTASDAVIDHVARHIATAAAGAPIDPQDIRVANSVVLEGRAVALGDDDHVVWVGRNVTAERVAQRGAADREVRLQQLNAELGRSNRDLAQFAYSASHDLSEPLRTVGSFVELLARRYAGELDDRAQEYISFAVDGVQRMRSLIDGLLAVASLRSAPPPDEVVDLTAVATAAWADAAAAAQDAGAHVKIMELPEVRGAQGELRQVFQNLFANAIKFRRNGCGVSIVVSAEVAGPASRISVEDDGIGIAPQHHDRVFNMFTRLHPRDQFAGSGIGLALCRQIVERHGGEIWIDAAPDRGTRVTFTCPTAGSTTSWETK